MPDLLDAYGGRWYRTRARDAVWEFDGGPGSVQLPYALLAKRYGPVTLVPPGRAPVSRSVPWHRMRMPALFVLAGGLVFAACWALVAAVDGALSSL